MFIYCFSPQVIDTHEGGWQHWSPDLINREGCFYINPNRLCHRCGRDIDKIKRFLNEHQQIEVQPLRLNSNDHVRILAGPFMHMDAKVISQKGKRVVVEIASLGVSLTANIYQNDLEIISYSRAVNF